MSSPLAVAVAEDWIANPASAVVDPAVRGTVVTAAAVVAAATDRLGAAPAVTDTIGPISANSRPTAASWAVLERGTRALCRRGEVIGTGKGSSTRGWILPPGRDRSAITDRSTIGRHDDVTTSGVFHREPVTGRGAADRGLGTAESAVDSVQLGQGSSHPVRGGGVVSGADAPLVLARASCAGLLGAGALRRPAGLVGPPPGSGGYPGRKVSAMPTAASSAATSD